LGALVRENGLFKPNVLAQAQKWLWRRAAGGLRNFRGSGTFTVSIFESPFGCAFLSHPMTNLEISSQALRQALEVYSPGTRAWFTDEQEAWISASVTAKTISDGRIKITFQDDNDSSKVPFLIISNRAVMVSCRKIWQQLPWGVCVLLAI
jgi:hypothetical protein